MKLGRTIAASLMLVLPAVAQSGDSKWSEDWDRCLSVPDAERADCIGAADKDYQDRVVAIHRQRVAAEEAHAALLETTKPQRQRLIAQYWRFLAILYPGFNHITVEAAPDEQSYLLMGRHSFFTRYSFDIGPQGPRIRQWIAKNARALKAAHVHGVGVGPSDNNDWVYYPVP